MEADSFTESVFLLLSFFTDTYKDLPGKEVSKLNESVSVVAPVPDLKKMLKK